VPDVICRPNDVNVVVAGRLYMSTRVRADQRKISDITAVGSYERPQGPDVVAIKHQVDVCTMSATNGVCRNLINIFHFKLSSCAPNGLGEFGFSSALLVFQQLGACSISVQDRLQSSGLCSPASDQH
jgi:hypothetical protein